LKISEKIGIPATLGWSIIGKVCPRIT